MNRLLVQRELQKSGDKNNIEGKIGRLRRLCARRGRAGGLEHICNLDKYNSGIFQA